MGTNLYVGGIPYTATDNDLRDLFAEYGTVASASIIMDRMTGRSRGFGFVEMSSSEEAQAAMDGLNNTEMMGRKIFVSEARPREERR